MNASWEQTPCLLCASDEHELLLEQLTRDLDVRCRIVRCRCCGLAYTNPRPTPQSIARYYPEDYSPHQPRHRPEHRGRRNPFRAWLPSTREGRLLDFGCGSGDLLRLMHGRGWQVTGIDASPRIVHKVRESFGLHALVGTLPHPDLVPASFDAITMAESLEHVHNPLRVLREACRLLTPGGRIIISVPNLDSLPFRWFGADWIGLDTPRHLTHFTPTSLRQMLVAAGFPVVQMRAIRHNSWLRHSARRAVAGPRWLRYRLPASLAGWYTSIRGRSNGILAVGVCARASGVLR
jgi:2-polyprenyl-3-methyl-5-hydroxy-6-metoxy-1,4-benzoquinol methylase